MATYSKRGDRWLAQVTINGKRKAKTLPTKAHAVAWAKMMEGDRASIDAGNLPSKTLYELFERYAVDISIHKGRDGRKPEYQRVKRFMKDELADIYNNQLSPQHIADWRDRQLKKMSGASVNRDWNLLSSIFTHAVKEWKWLYENPAFKAKRPENGKARTRRPTQDEIDRLLAIMVYSDKPVAVSQRLAVMMLFAIETGMRSGEMCRTEWINVHEKSVLVPSDSAKNGHERVVPLSMEARRLIDLMDKNTKTLFNLSSAQVDANFRKWRNKIGIIDLHFHDFRREALTRLAKKVDVMTLAKISGHRDVKVLLNTYYAPEMNDVADLLG